MVQRSRQGDGMVAVGRVAPEVQGGEGLRGWGARTEQASACEPGDM